MESKFNLDRIRLTTRRLTIIIKPVGNKIIKMLMEEEAMNIEEIAKNLGYAKPTISYYLLNMTKKKILKAERRSIKIYYSLNTDVFNKILKAADVCTS